MSDTPQPESNLTLAHFYERYKNPVPELRLGYGQYVFGFSETRPEYYWILTLPEHETEDMRFDAKCAVQDIQHLLPHVLAIYNSRDRRMLDKVKRFLPDTDRKLLRGMLTKSRGKKPCWKLGLTWSLRFLIEELAGIPFAEWSVAQRFDHGYVYLLQSPTGAYKIGHTKNPDNRLRTFNVKLPFEVEFVVLIPTDEMRDLEHGLHNRFAQKRINGEWFALDSDDVEYIKSLAVES